MRKIIIHGGCGAREDKNTSFKDYHDELLPIIEKSKKYLDESNDALKTAVYAVKLLESNPIFNAGTGSRVQQDGQIRMSASIIDSKRGKFAGVINIQNIEHPVEVAYKLMGQHHSVLSGEQATLYAKKALGFSDYNPMTEQRWNEFLELRKGYTGTVGAVVLDDSGNICAATSTGGAGYEVPGRVGDSPTVAGNFASKYAGVACTGIGEHILNNATATKIATRVEDGMQLQLAVDKSISESNMLGDYVGLIGIDSQGNIAHGSTKIAQTLFATYINNESKTFYELL